MNKELQDYVNGLKRQSSFKVCKRTKRLGQQGLGFRRSLNEEPVRGRIIGSYRLPFSGGYFLECFDTGKIIQCQSFREKIEKNP